MTNMVDSCIGEAGINYLNQVNLLGTYYHPIVIFIDIRFLKTLNYRDFKSGLVESVKKAFIADIDLQLSVQSALAISNLSKNIFLK